VTKKIILDINHPAHVHFLRNSYFELVKQGHFVKVIVSYKPLVPELLKLYDIPYTNIGEYGESLFSKFIMLIWLNIKMFFICLKFKPDVVVGIVTIRGAHISRLLGFKSIVFTDTEHAKNQINLFKYFATEVHTPINFPYQISNKHIYYDGYHELAYLHRDHYKPDKNVLKLLQVEDGEPYIIIRFVAWNATHDTGMSGITQKNKVLAVESFLKYGRVFITSEKNLPDELKKYAIKIPVDKIHDAIYYSSLVFGESATMASEASVLGVPSVYVDNAGRCYTDDQHLNYQILHNFSDDPVSQQNAIDKSIDILDSNINYRPIRERIMSDKINTTDYIIKNILK